MVVMVMVVVVVVMVVMVVMVVTVVVVVMEMVIEAAAAAAAAVDSSPCPVLTEMVLLGSSQILSTDQNERRRYFRLRLSHGDGSPVFGLFGWWGLCGLWGSEGTPKRLTSFVLTLAYFHVPIVREVPRLLPRRLLRGHRLTLVEPVQEVFEVFVRRVNMHVHR